MSKIKIQDGSKEAPASFYIKIVEDGPYLVYGNPPIRQEIIYPDCDGNSWSYRKGEEFTSPAPDHCALCRCGASGKKPFCDGSHKTAEWDGTETNDRLPLLDNAEVTEGPSLILADNESYCAFARFCDAHGRIWNIVQSARGKRERDIAIHEAEHCPAGRLVLMDRETGKVYEPPFDPSIAILEDPGIKVSGPIWVKGGIRIESADGSSYEVRNRVTLCRCGGSCNKPFCDGTHAQISFNDNIPIEFTGEEW